MAERAWRPVGFETVTVSTTPVSLTVPDTAEGAYLSCETNDIRWRADGADPTATVGHVLTKGELLTMPGRDILVQFRMIRVGSGDAVLSCTYLTEY